MKTTKKIVSAEGWIALLKDEKSDRYCGYPLIGWELVIDEDGEAISSVGLALLPDQKTLFSPSDRPDFRCYVPPNTDPYMWIDLNFAFQLPVSRSPIAIAKPFTLS